MKVLVIANNARSIVCSARKAGHTVYAIDRFGDVDLLRCSDKAVVLNYSTENKLHEIIASFGEVDAVILGPGFEKLRLKNTFNNPIEIMEEVSDKSKLPKKLKSMGIPHPETEPISRAGCLRFPLMLKPKLGSGGMRNMIVRSEEELSIFKERNDACEFIAQEFVQGMPCSASVISTGDDAVVVALNEQLIGIPWLTRLPFAYCGNITPFHTKFSNEMIHYAEQIALEFGLLGSNGIDFILSENGIAVIEVNPRFQGSIDTVEQAMGMNIFDAHIKSFAGELPQLREPVCFAAKTIVYANKNVVIDKKIQDAVTRYMNMGQAADVPQPGYVILPDEPITTMLATAETRSLVLGKVNESSRYIKGMSEA
ncbi:MAG: ATP-grasp domain-containing protein [Euryarchaeota archaeon]|nr:ATP-grasp domain-containing protein [Euryarchaeota archaeon]MBU4492536.1 ATP-grasp domain-containing protein [Euryarchaeota archaeon]MCG2728006.1 ATP-grasp domain-containing protein [Candidatus Methanoperedenaceae archaeon]